MSASCWTTLTFLYWGERIIIYLSPPTPALTTPTTQKKKNYSMWMALPGIPCNQVNWSP